MYRIIKGEPRGRGSQQEEAGMEDVSTKTCSLLPPDCTCSNASRHCQRSWRLREVACAYPVIWPVEKATEDWARRGRMEMPASVVELHYIGGKGK